MKLTDLQKQVLGAMRDKPITGIDLKRACGHSGSNRAFSNALIRMRNKGLIDVIDWEPITYVPTARGLFAFGGAAESMTISKSATKTKG